VVDLRAHDDVGVNLIGDDHNVMLGTDVDEPRELADGPHSADRVVRAAQNEKFCTRIDFLLEIVEIHRISAIPNHERIFYQLTAVVQDGRGKRIVYGGLNDDLLSGLCEGLNGDIEGWDDAR
jgi:hypothetical protein